jgi:transposase
MAVPIPTREIIVKRRLQGHSLASTAMALNLSYDTVKNIWRRYRLRGVAGLNPDYHCRKRRRTTPRRRSIRAACWLKRHHPTWGARRIRKLLQERWPDRAIPNERSLQRGFQEAGVHSACGRTGGPAESEHASRQWMLRVLQCRASAGDLRSLISNDGDLRTFLKTLKNGKLKDRNKVLAVLAGRRGIPHCVIARFLFVTRKTIASYCNAYEIYGCERLFEGFYDRLSKSDDELLQNTLFSVLHTPPSAYGINRTSWRMPDLRRVLAEKGQKACPQVIREIIRAAGYSWKKARKVLTSTDPQYQEKLAKIQSILSTLGPKERFFSIDEYGPFAVKMQGGRSLTPPGKVRVVPQRQKSKGSLIVTAALELSTNQVTHFYSEKKNSAEMIKLLEILVKQYADTDKIYMSWDAASWHASKLFYKRVDQINSPAYRAEHKTPHVELAPLPSCAQFLNVIESVFSGMARAIIHNSDYESLAACKAAIDRHFAERNAFFKANPKKAGRIIWGKEITPSTFSPANNCKYRHHFFYGL